MHKNSLNKVRRTSQVAKYSFDRLLKIVQVNRNDFLFNTYNTKCSPHNPNTVKADYLTKWSNGAKQFLILYTKHINKNKTKNK